MPSSSETKILRLSKLMSERGLCSRREADHLIEQELVEVNGKVVTKLGLKVSPDAKVKILKKGQEQLDRKVTFLIHKPIGYVSSQPEKNYSAAVELITAQNQDTNFLSPLSFSKKMLFGLAPAGRLDIDSRGLLVLTQNGQVAKKLIGPNSCVEKEYFIRVLGELSSQKKGLLENGLSLDEKKLKPAFIKIIESNSKESSFYMTLTEGKKRQIRRCCELVKLKVIFLKRIRIGNIRLNSLAEGKWRFLGDNENF